MSPSRALSSSIDLGGTWQGVRTSFWLLLLIIAYVDGTPRGVCASRVNGRLVSEDSGPGKLGSYQDVFKDAQFFVLKWKAQARVTEMFAEVEHAMAEQKLSQEKELAEHKLSHEKELAEHKRMLTEAQHAMAEQKLSQEKELAEQKLSMIEKISRLDVHLQYSQQETLRSKGLLTSRGVLEMALMHVHHEINSKDRFNAHRTCSYLNAKNLTEGTGAWKLVQCYNQTLDKHPQSVLSHKSIATAYRDLYGSLSQAIHGYPWSGDSVCIPTCCDTVKLYLSVVLVLFCTLSWELVGVEVYSEPQNKRDE
jgi:hypothetical protein